MIMSRFRSMGLAAGAAASVLSCYMVSLRVARERGEVQRIEQQIADAHRDIRDLTTELGTRGRMRQLERWNSDVLALSAPGAAQYLNGTVELASYQPVATPAVTANDAGVIATAAVESTAKAIPAVEVNTAARSEPKLMTASYTPKPAKKAKTSDGGPIRTASLKPKAAKKAKGSDVALVRLASNKPKSGAKSKAKDASLVRTASYKPRATTKSGGANAGLIHTASYVTTRKIGPTRVALLDDDVLHDIGRAAAHEVKAGRRAVP